MRWTTSARSMNCNWASAMMRFLSSEGWNEKSKPASVLIAESRAIVRAILMRRFSRKVISSCEQSVDGLKRVDLAALEAAHVARGSQGRAASSGPTRLRLMRSITAGAAPTGSAPSRSSSRSSLAREATADSLVEG